MADFTPAINSFNNISGNNKALILKVARAVNKKRPLDLSEFFDQMANDWEQGMQCLINTLDISV
jgi:predicted transcriptional regulator